MRAGPGPGECLKHVFGYGKRLYPVEPAVPTTQCVTVMVAVAQCMHTHTHTHTHTRTHTRPHMVRAVRHVSWGLCAD